MKLSHWIVLALAGFSLTACDVVKFPGVGSKEERPVPPPPIAPETPVAIPDDASNPTEVPAIEVTPVEPPAPDLDVPLSLIHI